MGSPLSPQWLDKSFLEVWLKAQYGDLVVTEIEVQPAAAEGDNAFSNVHRLVVQTNTGDSYSLIIKCRIQEGVTSFIRNSNILWGKEKEMYENTLPRISALLQKLMKENFEPLAPQCFYCCDDFMVLEDLSFSGFKMLERREGLDLEHCLLVMRSLARLHAASVVLHEEDPQSMKVYNENFVLDPSIRDTWWKLYRGMARTLAEEVESWPEEFKRYSYKLRCLGEDLMKRLQRLTTRNDSEFNVLTHSDLWTNNIFFLEGTTSIRILDFQLLHFATPVIDLHYFIVTSAMHDVIANHVDRLLQEYHATLCKSLTDLGYSQSPITLEELHEEFDKKALYGLFSLISPYAIMQNEPDSGFNLNEAVDMGKTPGPSIYGENYKKTAKCLIPLLDRKGAFEAFQGGHKESWAF